MVRVGSGPNRKGNVKQLNFLVGPSLFVLLVILCVSSHCFPCTIVMVSKGGVQLVGNNEDWIDPNAWMTVHPATGGEFGRITFGFGHSFAYAQGGMNDQGLFVDGNGLADTGWVRDPGKDDFRGSLLDHILANCATVDDVAVLFEKFNQQVLRTAKIAVADAKGQSAVIEWGKGRLQILRRQGAYQISTNFVQSNFEPESYPCSRYKNVDKLFSSAEVFNVDLVRSALDVTASGFAYPTVYSNIYDLPNRRIYLYNFEYFEQPIVLDLTQELKGGSKSILVSSLFRFQPHTARVYELFLKATMDVKQLEETASQKGGEEAVSAFYRSKKAMSKFMRFPVSEDIRALGTRLLNDGKTKDSIAVLELAASEDPTSWQTFYELAKAYARDGRTDRAIQNARVSLELNPGDPAVQEFLKGLSARNAGRE